MGNGKPKGEINGKVTDSSELVRKVLEMEKQGDEMNITRIKRPTLNQNQRESYRKALLALNDSDILYMVGSAFARYAYTGIWRHTKDLDIFLKPEDLKTALNVLREAEFETEVRAKHWLAKAWKGPYFVDLIFGTGNGQLPISDASFTGAPRAKILGIDVFLIPIEEMIASAAYVAVRDRFDGAEIAHLIKSARGKLDWQRILDRLGENHELLLWHLIFFDFIYPGHSDYLPKDLMVLLFNEIRERWDKKSNNPKKFRGTILDPFSFVVDIKDWGYEDRRKTDPLVNERGESV